MLKLVLILLLLSLSCVCYSQVKVKPYSFIGKVAAKINKSTNFAVTIGNTIFVSCSLNEFLSDTSWVKHELCHTRQYDRYGILEFGKRYLFYYIIKGGFFKKRGYLRNPFEIEANNAE